MFYLVDCKTKEIKEGRSFYPNTFKIPQDCKIIEHATLKEPIRYFKFENGEIIKESKEVIKEIKLQASLKKELKEQQEIEKQQLIKQLVKEVDPKVKSLLESLGVIDVSS